MTRRTLRSVVLSLVAITATACAGKPAATAAAPQAAAPVVAQPVPSVGDMAPDFEIRGATRYGVVKERKRLSDYRGQTVVIAFFIQARTRG